MRSSSGWIVAPAAQHRRAARGRSGPRRRARTRRTCAGKRRAMPMTRRAPSFMSHVRPGAVEAGAVDELLEHQRVLRLLDDLVVGVAELRGAVGQLVGVLEQARASGCSRTAGRPSCCRRWRAGRCRARVLRRQRAVPRRWRRAGCRGRARSAGRSGRSRYSGVVPVDVGVGVEVLHDRLVAEAAHELGRSGRRAAPRRASWSVVSVMVDLLGAGEERGGDRG